MFTSYLFFTVQQATFTEIEYKYTIGGRGWRDGSVIKGTHWRMLFQDLGPIPYTRMGNHNFL